MRFSRSVIAGLFLAIFFCTKGYAEEKHLPKGAIQRLGSLRFRHSLRIGKAAFCPDSRAVVTDGEDGYVSLWELPNGERLFHAKGKLMSWKPFSGDGRFLVYRNGNVIHLRDLKHKRSAPGFPVRLRSEASVHAVGAVFSANTKVLALWQPNELHWEIDLFDLTTFKKIRKLAGPGRRYNGTDAWLSPDGSHLVALGNGDRQIQVLDVRTGKKIAERHCKDNGFFSAVSFGYKGRILATIDQTVAEIKVLDLLTGKLQCCIKGPKPRSTATQFSPEGKTVICWQMDSPAEIQFWDALTGEKRNAIALEKGAHGYGISPDGKRLLVRSVTDRTLFRIVDLKTKKVLHRFEYGHGNGGEVGFGLSPDEKYFLATDGSGTFFFLWDVATGKKLPLGPGHRLPVYSMAFTKDGRQIASMDDSGTIILWEIKAGKILRQYHSPHKGGYGGGITWGLFFDSQGRLRKTEGMEGFTIKDAWTQKVLLRMNLPPGLLPVLSADRRMLAASGNDGIIRVFDLRTKGQIRQWVWYRQKVKVALPGGGLGSQTSIDTNQANLAFSPDGRFLVARGTHGGAPSDLRSKMTIWEMATGDERYSVVKKIPYPVQFSPYAQPGVVPPGFMAYGYGYIGRLVGSVGFSPDQKHLILGNGTSARLMDVMTGKEVRRFGDDGVVGDTAVFSPNGQFLAARNGQGDLYLWEARSGRKLAQLHHGAGSISHFCFSPNSRQIATAGQGTTILIWDIPSLLKAPSSLTKEKLEQHWEALGGKGSEAHQAIVAMKKDPGATLGFLKPRVKPLHPPSAKKIQALLDDLNSRRFATRQKAVMALEQMGDMAIPALRELLDQKPDLEVKRRAQALLNRLMVERPDGAVLRLLRVVELLEAIGNRKAIGLLKMLADGEPYHGVTRVAIAALRRMKMAQAAIDLPQRSSEK